MDIIQYARTMAAYNRWMNDRLYEACDKLPDEQRKCDLGAFFKSIHGTLNHLLLADRVWLGRLTGTPFRVKSLDQELHAEFEALRADRQRTDEALSAWVDGLGADDLDGDLSYSGVTNPRPRKIPLGLVVVHLFNHQTHHRGQLTTLLLQSGVDPGATDLLVMPPPLR
jgi:uncharacterized damage-inducible protein DinB